MVMVSAVLFTRMGLSEEIQRRLGISVKILSCSKCCTFWCCVVLLLVGKNGFVKSVTVSFIFAYLAQWLALTYDMAAMIYNRVYEKITENPGPPKGVEVSDATSGENGSETDTYDEVPQMQLKDDTLRDDKKVWGRER